MNDTLQFSLQWTDWLSLFFHFLLLSLLSIGGAITTAPEMHRFLVAEKSWLTDAQFNASIALAQAAPGPNVLFVALLGWHYGINVGNVATGLLGVAVTMVGILLPSTTMTYLAARWAHQNRDLLAVRSFKQGMAPIVVALLLATGWILADTSFQSSHSWGMALVILASAMLIWLTRIHLLWLLGAGALLGALGWI